jgi:very-short-patch-repair endonuclease
VNRTIRADNGDPLRRYDLSWPSVRVIVEYDGRHHVERESQWEADLERREAIDDDGWRIVVITARGIYREPGRTVERVWRVLRARGLSGLPARPSERWRAHFPGRS